ncbi:hypothetical protein AVEN_219318-1 [Araneus ventricosus]|uniref:RNase H type-1 domain-containing protein n=1 Tax=Araneus ventricosus TaxID=182803 RepID=A0A4Y2BEK2_ARAVE|nr:hypothetical protein AVEN_219318-1 [Araneus ventricosus]
MLVRLSLDFIMLDHLKYFLFSTAPWVYFMTRTLTVYKSKRMLLSTIHLGTYLLSNMLIRLLNLIKNTTAPVVLQQIFYYHRCQYADYIKVFTDGSKADGHVGFGVTMDDASYSHILSVFCSVYTAEEMEISYALKLISSSQYRKFCIYGDSMRVLQQLENIESATHPISLNIADTVQCLKKKGFDIIFCWTPSHVGILGNEKADNVARTASILLKHTVPFADILKSVQHYIFNKGQETWDLQVNNKLHRIKPSLVLWPIFPIRGFSVKLTRLRIGHTWYTYIHLLYGDSVPLSTSCNEVQTVDHILTKCPDFNSSRLNFLKPLF